MADLLGNASDWLRSQRRSHAAVTVIYRRGAFSVSLLATRGATRIESQGNDIVLHSEQSDWIVDAADLVLDSVAAEPQRNDTIEQVIDGVTRVYQVVPLGPENCWRWHDRLQAEYRIHTRFKDQS